MTACIDFLAGNPDLERGEILDGYREDAGVRPAGLPDNPHLEREMARAFRWDDEESPEEVQAHYEAWLSRQCA